MLILDNGDVILDSYVIVEYLNELAGGSKLIPDYGPTRWKVKSDHSLLQGMLDSMLLCRYEKHGAAGGAALEGVVATITGTGPGAAWRGSRSSDDVLNGPLDHRADRPRLRARLCRFPLRRLRLAQGLSEARRVPPEDAGAAVGEDLGAAGGVVTNGEASDARGQACTEAPRPRRRLVLAVDPLRATARQIRPAACPAKLDDGWTIASPDSVGLDGKRLCTIAARLKLTDSDIHAVVIARHGKLVFEQYFAGIDQPWGKPEAQLRLRRDDHARHALGDQERDLAAGRHRDRPQNDQERQRRAS